MFFRKRVRVLEFLQSFVGQLLNEDGIFIHEDFIHHIRGMLPVSGSGEDGDAGAPSEPLINYFIGTYLWLIKYRTLSNLFNSPRKQAWLDLNFDLATPEVVDRCFGHYDAGAIKDTYDSMDIDCKKEYTGELQNTEKPRFLVSPLWARDPEPHPFRVAARLFLENAPFGEAAAPPKGPDRKELVDALETYFNIITEDAARAARRVNLV